MAYIEFKDVEKIYKMGEVDLKALDKANFEIEKGELVVILGQSGSGKSTCLNILGIRNNYIRNTSRLNFRNSIFIYANRFNRNKHNAIYKRYSFR